MIRFKSKKARDKEWQDLLNKAINMRDSMPEHKEMIEKKNQPDPEAKPVTSSDSFDGLKTQLLNKIKSTKETSTSLKELTSKQSSTFGNRTTGIIQKQQQVRSDLKEANEIYKKLCDLHSKNIKKTKDKDVEKLELNSKRTKLLNQVNVQMMKLKESSLSGFISQSSKTDDNNSTNEVTKQFLFNATSTNTFSNTSADFELTDDQQLRLEQVQKKDQEFDQILEQIELAVESAGEMAKAINSEVESQNKTIEEVEEKVDSVEKKVLSANERLKYQIVSKTGCNFERFCINSICCILLLGILGVFLPFI